MGLGQSKIEEIISGLNDDCIADSQNSNQQSLTENDAVPISNNNEDAINQNSDPRSGEEASQQQSSSSSSTPSSGNENGDFNDQSNNCSRPNLSNPKQTPIALVQNINNTGSGQVCATQIGHAESIHIGNVIHINSELRNMNKSKPPPEKKPTSNSRPPSQFEDILKSGKEVDRDILNFVSEQIGYKWKKLARELGLEESVIEEVDHDNHMYGLSEIAFKMLEEWCKSNGADSTIGKLATALSEIGRNDIVLKLN